MSGVKGRSGRKTHYDEMAACEIVNLSQKTVRDYLLDQKIPIDKRVLVAKDFAAKVMPTKIEGLKPNYYVYITNDTTGRDKNSVEVLPAQESKDDQGMLVEI